MKFSAKSPPREVSYPQYLQQLQSAEIGALRRHQSLLRLMDRSVVQEMSGSLFDISVILAPGVTFEEFDSLMAEEMKKGR